MAPGHLGRWPDRVQGACKYPSGKTLIHHTWYPEINRTTFNLIKDALSHPAWPSPELCKRRCALAL